MKKIYFGCSLTHASQEFKDSIESLKNILRKEYQILDFVGLVKGTPRDVFLWDTKCVKDCDLFVADFTYPAIGVGYELGIALEHNKPILAVAHKDAKVTRIVLGVDHPKYTFVRYSDIKEVISLIKEKIKNL